MTGNFLIDALISIIGIVVVVVVIRLAMSDQDVTMSLERAKERLAFDEPDFDAVDWLVNNRAALARNAAGELASLFVVGSNIATRRFAKGTLKGKMRDNELTIIPNDQTSRTERFVIDVAKAPDWSRIISEQCGATGKT